MSLPGDLDLVTAAQAGEARREGFDVLDVSELEFLDSSGLQVLVDVCQGRDPKALLRGAKGQVQKILELSGIGEIFQSEAPQPGVSTASQACAARSRNLGADIG